MNDETEAAEVEATETHEHAPAKQGSGGSGIFLATLLAVVALGGSGYLWQQQQQVKQDNDALEKSIDKLLGVMEKRHQEQIERFKSVPEHHHTDSEQQLQQQQAQLQQQGGKLQQMEGLVYDLRKRLGQERRGWMVAEVEYLLRIAEHRLNLEHDTLTAIAALRAARSRLELQDNPKFADVIQQIGEDINTLSAIELPDRDAMANQIAGIAAGVEALPLASATTKPAAQPGESQTPQEPLSDDSWKAIWQKVWRDIRGLVTIRRDGEAEQVVMVPEQRYFLRQNLQLKLESARLALLAGNGGAWRASLEEAADWLRRYFDPNALAVSTALSTLERLAAVELNPALPTLSDTRTKLQQASLQPEPLPALPQAEEKPQAPAEETAPATATAEPPKAAETGTGERDAGDSSEASESAPQRTEEADTPSQPAATSEDAATETPPASEAEAPPPATPDDMPSLPKGESL